MVREESNFKPRFRFSEFLDCKYVHRDTNLQARLSDKYLYKTTLCGKGLDLPPIKWYAMVPGIYDVPEGKNDTNFSRSLNRIKEVINKNQVASTRPHLTLGGSFPYEPGDAFHFLGSKGRICLGCIAKVCGAK